MKQGIPKRYIHKIWLIMRLTTVFLIAAIMQVSAAGFAQKITMTQKNASLEAVIKELRVQSGYNFVVRGELLDNANAVSIRVKNLDFKLVLDQIFENQPISYEINDKTVVLKVREKGFFENLVANLQAIDVRGKVLDEKDQPLVGATIKVKGKSSTVTTGQDGAFFLRNIQEDDKLVISFIGYISREISVGDGSAPLVIKLEMATGELEEVGVTVNTGYQKIKPEQSTGAISVITTKDYESRISTNFLDGLVNRLPGLMINDDVTFTTGITGTASSRSLFNIRGISTMTGNQNPLIVVDGYPTELSLNMIDPNEIESVTILKDAAAATVYGVRASNGVIVIVRKQASRGEPQVVFRATAGLTPKEDFSRYRWSPDGSAINVDYQRNRYRTSVNANTWNALSTRSGAQAYVPTYYILAQQAANVISETEADAKFAELSAYNNAEDYSRLFLQTAATQTYNLNASGGTEHAKYYVTANYIDNSLQAKTSGNNRLLLSGRTTLNFSKRLSLELNTEYQEERSRSGRVPGIYSLNSYDKFQDAEGNPAAVFTGSALNPYYNSAIMARGLEDHLYYPLVDMNEISDQRNTANNRTTANFNYKIGNGFDLSFGGIYESSRTNFRHYATGLSSEARQYVNSYASQATDGSITFNIPKGGFLQQQTANTTGYTARTQLNYNKRISGEHSLNGIIGGELRKITDQGGSTAYFGYNDQTLLQQSVNYANITSNVIQRNITMNPALNYTSLFNQLYNDNRYLSAYSNIVYSFRDTYSLTGSIRIDQSNLFGTDPRYKYKPLWSVGAAWNIHKESFMENVTWVKQLKLRAADGFNGNVAKMSLPQVIARSIINTSTVPSSTALQLSSYANSSLRWEQTHNFNLGLDYQVFKGISGSLDYYYKNSKDLLAGAFINPTIGTSPSLINSGSIRNQGLELSLRADWITTPRFNWNTGLVLAHNTSKVLDVYQNLAYYPEILNGGGYIKDYPAGAIFAYRTAGLDAAGLPQLKDEQGNLYSISNSTASLARVVGKAAGTIMYMGTSVPAVNAGLSNRVDFGNFYLYCMVNYYGGFKTAVPRPDPTVIRPLAGSETYWKQAGDEQLTDVMSLTAFGYSSSRFAYYYSDNYVVNGDYLTLADLTVSYSFRNTSFLRQIGLSNFELKAQGSNLWTVGLNKYNYSAATGNFDKGYLTPTYTFGLFTNF